MKLEVLISTLNDNPKSLIKKMNIQTDAIIVCQCDRFGYEEVIKNKNKIRIYYFAERGVGLSRNKALLGANADIVLCADDDEILKNNYEQKIIEAFKKNDKADMIVFNIEAKNSNRIIYNIKKNKRIHKYNCLRYGAVRMAFKLNKVRKANISITLLCGGGSQYGSGEDSLFIYDFLNKGLKVYSMPLTIATVDFSESSWFKGYDEKYFFDKGVLLYLLHGKFVIFFIFIYLIRHRYMYQKLGIKKSFHNMKKGYLEIKHI